MSKNGASRAPVDRIERWPIAKLVPYAKNPRHHSPEQIEALVASLGAYGQTQLVVVDGDPGHTKGEIIVGHGRVMAAQKLGWQDIVVGIAVGWTAEQKRAYRISDNQTALLATWDTDLLKSELQALQLENYDLQLLAFDDGYIAGVLAEALPEADGGSGPQAPTSTLAERFGAIPFSVLNAREGWWQARKDAWIGLGIQSELGRGTDIVPTAIPGGSAWPTVNKATGKIARADSRGRVVPGTDAKKRRKDAKGKR